MSEGDGMLPVWEEIKFLIYEARLQLEMAGYEEGPGTEAIMRDETDDSSGIIGATVFAYDAEGNRGQEDVWYPDGWEERERREREPRSGRGEHGA
jgi:hypothetical protein